jgi:protein involved in polysaccharide export with SLBB domain
VALLSAFFSSFCILHSAFRTSASYWLAGMCLMLATGCAVTQTQLEKALLADRQPAAHTRDLASLYRLRCPDVLDVRIEGHPEHSGRRTVGANGRINISRNTTLRVSGHTVPEIGQALAEHLHVGDQSVHVRVAEYKSQSIYLFSDVDGVQKVVPYHGPETVIDLLQRLGGVSSRSAPREIEIVRSHIADGKPPEVFHVNLGAILVRHDQHTNIRLEPFDRVYIGQNRSSRIADCLPPLLLPVFRPLFGL